jgi:hypothetical protein
MRDLVDKHYPEADVIRVVLDNLSTHSAAALYQAFEPAEARRIRVQIPDCMVMPPSLQPGAIASVSA